MLEIKPRQAYIYISNYDNNQPQKLPGYYFQKIDSLMCARARVLRITYTRIMNQIKDKLYLTMSYFFA